MKIKIKKLSENAVIPKYAKEGDAGLDLIATSQTFDSKKGFVQYGTDLAFEIPEGFVGLLFPRSSISDYNLTLCNAIGVVDSGYRGEVIFRFKKIIGRGMYEVGDKIGQLIILPFPKIELEEVEELGESERNEGGFGSSDNCR